MSVALQEDHFSQICTKVWGKQPDGGVSSRVFHFERLLFSPEQQYVPNCGRFHGQVIATLHRDGATWAGCAQDSRIHAPSHAYLYDYGAWFAYVRNSHVSA